MNIIDIILVIPIVWAMYLGFKAGFISQLTGMAGVIAGIWLGFRFGRIVGEWLDPGGDSARVLGFIVVAVLALIGFALLGRLLGKLLKITGLGMLDTVGGMLVAALKMLLILSALLVCLDVANNQWHIVRRSTIDRSRLYNPIMKLAPSLFPVINTTRTFLFDDNAPGQ